MRSQIRIVGTNHISKHSASEIKKAFEEFQPDVVAVELDRNRLHALMDSAKNGLSRKGPPISAIPKFGLTGWLFLAIGGYVQRKLAGVVKVIPGVDMLEAINLAHQNKKQVALVDQDVNITVRRLSNRFSWKEKFTLLWDIFAGPFVMKKYKIKIDKVPNKLMIKKLMQMLQDRYPNLYSVLIEERNIHMCVALDRITRNNEVKVLLVIGAGHEDDLRNRLTNMEHADVI